MTVISPDVQGRLQQTLQLVVSRPEWNSEELMVELERAGFNISQSAQGDAETVWAFYEQTAKRRAKPPQTLKSLRAPRSCFGGRMWRNLPC